MKTDDFFMHGTSQLDASLGPNSATAQEKRRLCVTLPRTNMNIYVYFPTALVSVKLLAGFWSEINFSLGNCIW